MILFGEGYFFFVLVIACLPAVVLGLTERSIKWYGLAASVFIVCLALGTWQGMLRLAGYCLFEYILIKCWTLYCARKPHDGKAYAVVLLLSLTPLIVWKVSSAAGTTLFACIGLSYMTFKCAQMVIETYDGLIENVSPSDFVYLLIFFPCISSGPIDRSRRFLSDLAPIPRAEYIDLLGDGIYRIIKGLLYKFAFASAFYQGMIWLGAGTSIRERLICMYMYGLYLFFDFAGYSLMAVGASYIFGIRTPDNFNKPFASTDIKDFWDRWHMTLSYWFRDYLFSRFMMRSIRGKWFKNKLTGASIGFMLDMLVMGLWHGLELHFIAYGLYHGLLLAGTEIYQKKSGFHKKHKKDGWYIAAGRIVTIQLVFIGFYIFSGRF